MCLAVCWAHNAKQKRPGPSSKKLPVKGKWLSLMKWSHTDEVPECLYRDFTHRLHGHRAVPHAESLQHTHTNTSIHTHAKDLGISPSPIWNGMSTLPLLVKNLPVQVQSNQRERSQRGRQWSYVTFSKNLFFSGKESINVSNGRSQAQPFPAARMHQ